MKERVAVIGGGISGLFSALYLAQAGFDTHLYERKLIAAETSDNFHGMIHSGARYAVNDPVSAKECISENRKIHDMAGNFLDNTGGYFLGITDQEAEFGDRLLKGCSASGIPAMEVEPEKVLKIEPYVNPRLKRAISVPDMVVHAFEFAVAVSAEAKMLGASFHFGAEVKSVNFSSGSTKGITISRNGEVTREHFDAVVNATGPFSSNLLRRSGLDGAEMMPSVGSMLVYEGRFNNSVLNRMRMPSDGDIIVPYGSASVLGTIATVVEDADQYSIEEEDVEMMKEEGSVMIPALSKARVRFMYSSVRPLMAEEGKDSRSASRSFQIVHLKESGAEGLFSITGGKYTTGRLIGQEAAEMVSHYFGSHHSHEDPDLNSTFQRFQSAGLVRNTDVLEIALSRIGTMDQERIAPAIAATIAASVGD